MELSLKKYLISALKFFASFLLSAILCFVLCFIGNNEAFVLIVLPIACMILLLLAGYYFAMFLNFRKKCSNFMPVEGVVFNWEAGSKFSGSIIVNVEGEEYSTSSYFSYEECKALVGKTISYAIIDETLFVYEIKN